MKSQAKRMERELQSLRDLFTLAEMDGDSAKMITLARVITAQEKAISTQREREELLLDRDAVRDIASAMISICTSVSVKYLPKATFHDYVDELIERLGELWGVEPEEGGEPSQT